MNANNPNRSSWNPASKECGCASISAASTDKLNPDPDTERRAESCECELVNSKQVAMSLEAMSLEAMTLEDLDEWLCDQLDALERQFDSFRTRDSELRELKR